MSRKTSEDILAGLAPKKRKYVEGRVNGLSKMDAALEAGYSESMAKSVSQRIETKDVQDAFRELVRRAIPAEKLVQRLAEGLDAVETEFAKSEGQITDSRDVVAWGERREYLKLAAQMGQYFKADEEQKYPSDTTKVILIGQVVTA